MNSSIVFYEKDEKFKIEIPRNGFTINESNQDFSEDLVAGWSYPFEQYLTDELIRIYGDPSNINLENRKRKDYGTVWQEGVAYPGCLKFVGCANKKIKLQLEFGYSSLAVFEKKLNELDLDVIHNGYDNFYQGTAITKKFPEVNINFPAVEVQRYNDDEKKYTRRGVYNLYKSGGFNSVYDPVDQIVYSYKAFVYLFHILQVGFASEKLTLAGDILQDRELLYSMLNHTNIPFEKREYIAEKKAMVTLTPDPEKFYSGETYQVTQEATISDNIIGEYYFSVLEDGDKVVAFHAELKCTNYQGVVTIYTLDLSETVTNGQVDVQKLLPAFTTYTDIVMKISVTMKYEGRGTDVKSDFSVYLIPTGTSPGYSYQWKTLDIRAVDNVPDITFGNLINSIRKARKYKMIISGNYVYFMKNYKNYKTAKDLSFSETDSKEILPNDREAYIVKLGSPEEYEHTKYLISTNEIKTDFEDSENEYETLEIGAYPLPVTSGNGAVDDVITAVELVEEDSMVSLIRYEGLQSGYNRCLNMNSFLVPYIYSNFYNDWVQNRLTAVPVKWNFKSDNFLLRDLIASDKIYCYGSFHSIKDMQKKFIGESTYEIELTTENKD